MESQWIQAGRLRARMARPAAPRGRPILLLHGMGGGAWIWERMQAWLAERGRASYALELPGRGEETGLQVNRRGLEDYAADAASALAQFPEAFFAGHSMGGLIAQHLAARQTAAGYIFWSSAPPWHMFRPAYAGMWRHAAKRPAWLLRGCLGQPILWPSSMQAALLDSHLSPAQRSWVRAKTEAESGRAVRQMAFGYAPPRRGRLGSPCAVLAAAEDHLIPIREQKRLAEYYDCELQVLPGGHMLPLEDAGASAAEWLDRWCARIESPLL